MGVPATIWFEQPTMQPPRSLAAADVRLATEDLRGHRGREPGLVDGDLVVRRQVEGAIHALA